MSNFHSILFIYLFIFFLGGGGGVGGGGGGGIFVLFLWFWFLFCLISEKEMSNFCFNFRSVLYGFDFFSAKYRTEN